MRTADEGCTAKFKQRVLTKTEYKVFTKLYSKRVNN